MMCRACVSDLDAEDGDTGTVLLRLCELSFAPRRFLRCVLPTRAGCSAMDGASTCQMRSRVLLL